MRILHVIPSVSPRYGGPSQAVLGMCRALLANTDVSVEIATTDADGKNGRLCLSSISMDESIKSRIHIFKRTFSESWKFSRELGTWLNIHGPDYDAIHVHGVFSYATTSACRAAARCGVPIILRPCGMLAPYSLGRSAVRKSLYWNLLEKRNARFARALHATTDEERHELQVLLPGQRAVTIPLGIDDGAWTTPRTLGAFRDRYGIPQECRLILFLSRLHYKKGIVDFALPTLSKLPGNVRLAIVGGEDPHDPKHLQLVRETAEKLGIVSRITYTGPLHGEAKWQAYDDADIYMLPSRHENFGATAVEALARGIPSVLSTEVQAGRFVEEAGAGRLVPLEVTAFVEAAAAMLNLDRNERQSIGIAAREYAKTRLSWASSAKKLRDLYCSIASDTCV